MTMKTTYLAALLTFTLSIPAFAADNRISGTVPVASVRAAKAAPQTGHPAQPIVEQKVVTKTVIKTGPQSVAPQPQVVVTQHPKAPSSIGTRVNYTGAIETYKAKGEDTLLTIGEREGLGYVELRSANPSMDPWQPGNGTFVILPKMHLLPDAPRKGIVVNLSEMRVYYYRPDGQIKSYPIGVGREGFSTPMGTSTVVRKAVGPTWRPTERMRREDPTLKPVYTAGPENPLGTHALYLGWPQYMLHGTNKPWGIGRRVSSGCVRMYNSAAEELYNTVPTGTPVAVVRQPIKFGWIGEMLYLEAHPDGALADQVERGSLEYKVPADIFANLSRAAGQARDNIDWTAVRGALRDRRGYPVPILIGATDENRFVTAAMEARAGTSRFAAPLTPEVVTPLTPGMSTLSQQQAGQPVVEASSSGPRRRSQGQFN